MSSRIVVKCFTNNNCRGYLVSRRDYNILHWRHIKITKSLDNICHTLELELPVSERDKVKRHAMIEVRLVWQDVIPKDRGVVTTVYIDEITVSVDATHNSLRVIGRSPARDIIDSTWSGQYFGTTLFKVAENICKSRGDITCRRIPYEDGHDFTGVIHSFTWLNESPWSKLSNEATNRGLVFTSDEVGQLYIWKPGGNPSEGFSLDEGKNIQTIEWTESAAEQYREYVTIGGDFQSVIDTDCPVGRRLTIDLTNTHYSHHTHIRRARSEMNRRKARRVTVTVPGWGFTDAELKALPTFAGRPIFWQPNLLIPVSMPSLELRDTLLVAEVEQEISVAGMSSTITLVNREAYLWSG
jgi:prophage tail gpP-like protein